MLKNTIVSLALLFASVTGAQAAPLSLTLLDTPDIVSAFIDVVYDSSSDSLTANGFALQLDDGSLNLIDNGLFTLNADIDGDGSLTGGALAISGTIAGLGYNSGTLLTATLISFGSPEAGADPLEFLFIVTGGDAAAMYGELGGIILTDSGFDGDWANDFDNLIAGIPGTGAGLADTAAVPVPAAAWLMLSALVGLFSTARQSR